MKYGAFGAIGFGASFSKKLEDPIFLRPFIKTEGIRPDNKSVFKVEVFNKTSSPNIIALLVTAKNNYFNRFNTNNPSNGKAFNMITVESSRPRDEYDYSAFTIRRTGISPNYVQNVSNVVFDYSQLKPSSKPSVIVQFEPQENTGDSERYFTIENTYTTRKTNKWTFEKGVELAIGTKITANLQVPKIGAGFGAEVSTEIKTSTKNTNEYAEEEEHAVSWSQHVPIPPHTRVSANLTATEAMVDVPFTATVYVKSEKTSTVYSYPVNGTYQGTRVLSVAVDITEKSLDQTHAIKSNLSQFDNQQPPILLGQCAIPSTQGV